MMKAVIDTNVLLVANGQHEGVSPACVSECVRRLLDMQKSGVVVIDDGYRILREYQKNINPNKGKGVGYSFLKWLVQRSRNSDWIEMVGLTEVEMHCFNEFPDPTLEQEFDAPDRVFAAVANAHPEKPVIWQAADSKWLGWWRALSAKGVRVDFLCPEEACNFYRRKYPEKPLPELPAET